MSQKQQSSGTGKSLQHGNTNLNCGNCSDWELFRQGMRLLHWNPAFIPGLGGMLP